MRWMKWTGIIAATTLIISCFFTWVVIPSRNIIVTGVDATGTHFGKPGYFNLLFAGIYLLLNFTPRIWAKRVNVIVAAFNVSWAVRNYFVVSTCRAGDCPEKHLAIYLMVAASVVMLVASLFPDIKIKAADN